MQIRTRCLWSLVDFIAATTAFAQGPDDWSSRVIVRGTDPASGLPGQVFVGFFADFHLGPSGHTVFAASVGTSVVDQRATAFAGGPGETPVPFLAEGDALPRPSGATVGSPVVPGIDGVAMNRSGQFIHMTQIAGSPDGIPDGLGRALFRRDTSGGSELLAATGDPVPGFPDRSYTVDTSDGAFDDVQINDRGHVAFLASIEGPGVTGGNDLVIIVHDDAGARVVAQSGTPMAGLGGARFDDTELYGLTNDGDLIAWFDLRNGNGIDVLNDTVLVKIDEQGERFLLQEGAPAPGSDPDADPPRTLPGIGLLTASVTRDGLVVYALRTRPFDESVVYRLEGESMVPVVQTGDDVTNLPGRTVDWVRRAIAGENGEIAMQAVLDPTDTDQFPGSLLVTEGTSINVIAQEGLVAPRVPSSATIESFTPRNMNAFGDISINSSVDGPSGGNADYVYDRARDEIISPPRNRDPIVYTTPTGDEEQETIFFTGSNGVLRFPSATLPILTDTREILFWASLGNEPIRFAATLNSGPCSPVDFVAPFGVTDLDDFDVFLRAFVDGAALADLVAPFGTVDLDDIDAFIGDFLAGCP